MEGLGDVYVRDLEFCTFPNGGGLAMRWVRRLARKAGEVGDAGRAGEAEVTGGAGEDGVAGGAGEADGGRAIEGAAPSGRDRGRAGDHYAT